MYELASASTSSAARSRSACACSSAASALAHLAVESLATFSSSADAMAMTAAAAEPLAGTGLSEARPSRSAPKRPSASVVADLRFALGDELPQLLVNARVDAGIGILLEHLLPARGSNHVSRLCTHAIPAVEVFGRRDPGPVETGPVVAQRVLGPEEVAPRPYLPHGIHRKRLLVD